MFAYNRLNIQKEERCQREGINYSHAPQFREMGDDSPLFRLVNCLITTHEELMANRSYTL
jgi:hypothetical protein